METIKDKYLITMPQDFDKSVVPGYLYYFNNNKITINYIPMIESDDFSYEYISTDKGENSVRFNILSKFNGMEETITFEITKDQDKTLKYKFEGQEQELELLDKEEFEQVLKDNYDLFELSNATDEFYNDFNLDIEKLSFNNLNIVEQNNSQVNSQDNSNQANDYTNKENAIKRVKEIISSVGIELGHTDSISTTVYEGRECWEFYIVVGGSAVHFLYLDVNSGEFMESVNPSLDWRYVW